MNHLQFRLWNGSSMEPVGEITFHTDGSFHVNAEYPVNDVTMERQFGGNKYYLMQNTGLSDKHGKPIYEGDLVRENWKDGLVTDHIVRWSQANGGFWMGTAHHLNAGTAECLEVVGHMYQRPTPPGTFKPCRNGAKGLTKL